MTLVSMIYLLRYLNISLNFYAGAHRNLKMETNPPPTATQPYKTSFYLLFCTRFESNIDKKKEATKFTYTCNK
jgi:hypothetical protein